jgi:tRNA-dihydrouridine synthase C
VPKKVFLREVPELKNQSVTSSGVWVQVQILGGDPERMALSALEAVKVGACGIDINFGCPAPTVNNNDGGATLLKYPNRICEIVSAVRTAIPKYIPVSAKLRLGWDDMKAIHTNAEMAEKGGASWITIHGRTKFQGYTPPAYWAPIGEVRNRLSIPVMANGEIWNLDDFKKCREQTGCEHFMIGRGALADPLLSLRIHDEMIGKRDWEEKVDWADCLERFCKVGETFFENSGYIPRRLKQWLRFADLRNEIDWFSEIKREERAEAILATARSKQELVLHRAAVRASRGNGNRFSAQPLF